MNEKVKNTGIKLKTFWTGLAKKIKLLIIGGASAILILAIVLTVALNKSDGWLVLFPGMTTEESTEVYLELQNMGVQTQIDSKGQIRVKEEEWDSLVYKLAELGYPESAPSYGTFLDNIRMTMTEFEKEQTLLIQLQERLEVTIKRIDGVRGAIVTISLPKDSNYVWKENDDTATASVLLTLAKGVTFTPENVSAVKNLVAYSAQKMKPEDVKVVDATTGSELLGKEEAGEPSNSIDTQERVDYTNMVKNQYEINAERILVPIYGNDGVTAVASVTVDYDKITEEVKELVPEDNGEGVKENEHVIYKTEGTVDEDGIVGEENNDDIPNYVNEEQTLNSDNTPYYERDTQWAISYILTQTEKAQGAIKDASIAVVVTTEGGYLSNEERDSVLQLVKGATNIDATKISVSSRASNTDVIQAGTEPDGEKMDWKRLLMFLIPGALVLILLIVLLIVALNHRSRKKLAKKLAEQEAANAATITNLQQTIEENKRQKLEEAAKEHGEQEQATANEVREFAKNNPELTAALIPILNKEDE